MTRKRIASSRPASLVALLVGLAFLAGATIEPLLHAATGGSSSAFVTSSSEDGGTPDRSAPSHGGAVCVVCQVLAGSHVPPHAPILVVAEAAASELEHPADEPATTARILPVRSRAPPLV